MRQFLARSIVAFAKLVTLPLADARAKDSIARALDALRVEPARVDMERGSILFDAGTATCARMAVMFPRYEPDTLEWLDAIPDTACLWDIGANVGMFSLYAALAPRRRVVAFEPAARTFAVLVRNIELNRMEDRIAAYCIALAQETRLDTLNMASTEPGGVLRGFGTETTQLGNSIDVGFRQPAVGFAIDDFVRIFAPPLPSHVKMDVDSIEAAILRGGRETLSAPSVVSMIVEIEGDHDSAHNREIYSLMAELGFTPRPQASPEYRNVIFDRN